jgi:hypothetical protein
MAPSAARAIASPSSGPRFRTGAVEARLAFEEIASDDGDMVCSTGSIGNICGVFIIRHTAIKKQIQFDQVFPYQMPGTP